MPWESTRKIKELAADETSFVPVKSFRSVPVNVALVFPNSYNLGMSNLGFHSMYYQINSRDDSLCHRSFLSMGPADFSGAVAMESYQPVNLYDIVGFSVSFEMDYIHILKILDNSHIPIFSKDRKSPLVMAGGPAVTFNPEPLAPFVDFFVIGEGEEIIHEILDRYNDLRNLPKEEILEGLSRIDGVYVPSFYDIEYDEKGRVSDFKTKGPAPPRVKRRWIRDLDRYGTESVVLTPHTEFKDMFLLEVSRGCGRNCRFCMAGYCYRIPRVRSLEKIMERAEFGAKFKEKVGLVGAAVSDYPRIDELSEEFIKRGIKFSVSSLRADTLREPLVKGLAFSNHRTLTIAPEAGSQRLRKVINKSITEEHVLSSIKMAHKYHIENIKLYYIVGLPTETDEDIDEMIGFLSQVKKFMKSIGNKTGHLSISVNPFIPKPFTPFQWFGMESVEIISARINKLQNQLKSQGIRVLFESPRLSEIQSALSRGDRLTGFLLHEIYRQGGKAPAYRKVRIDNKGVEFYAHRSLREEDTLPWDHIDIGLKKGFFANECRKAVKGESTRRCDDEICKVCNICQLK
jgi:radical SAM superfamily enzyme YgiQ (UPF0313 family)